MDRGRAGCPACLDYCSVLEAVKLACDRSALLARLQRDGQSYPPSVPWLTAALKEEWAALPELHAHLKYVEAPVQSTASPACAKGGFGGCEKGREGMGPSDFLEEAPARRAGLTGPEVLALRLYAGPGHAALDRSLRAHSGRFPVTQFCLDAAIGKLAQVNAAAEEPLFRPMRAEMPGGWLKRYHRYRGIAHKRLALNDPAPVNTTLDLDLDPEHLFFELHPAADVYPESGFLSCAADVQWVAQSLTSSDMLLPSNTVLIPRLQCVSGPAAQEFAPQFMPYYPWDFERNLPLVTADYLPLANALLQLVHQAEGRRLQEFEQHELMELAVDDIAGSPSLGLPAAPRASLYGAVHDLRRASMGWKALELPAENRRPSQLFGLGPGQSPSQGRRPSVAPVHRTSPRHLAGGSPRSFPLAPRRSLAPDGPAGGTDAVHLSKLRLYTVKDVELLERRQPLKPSLGDALELAELGGLGPYPPVPSVAHPFPGSAWEPRWWEHGSRRTRVALFVGVACLALIGAALGILLPVLLGPRMVSVATPEFDPSLLADRLIVAFHEPPTNLTRLSELAGVEVVSVRQSTVGYVLELGASSNGTTVDAVVANLKASGLVRSAEADVKVSASRVPNDPLWYLQWASGPKGVGAPAAWDITTGSSSIIVAVTDSGILNHEDLKGHILPGYDMISDPNIANDGDGRDSNPADPGDSRTGSSSWHGTFCSGIVAGVPNNGIGIAGMAWNAKILPVRCLGVGGGYLSDWADAARWAAGLTVSGVPKNPNKAHVISASLGSQTTCPGWLQSAINDVVAAGVTIVVAAGNSAADAGGAAPAGCSNVITVAAHGPSGNLAYYSNRGPRVDVMAPGGDMSTGRAEDGIVSLSNTGKTSPGYDAYGFSQGTSFATPYVSGLVALMLSVNPTLRPAAVRDILRRTTRPFVSGACTKSLCGAGLVDAAAALRFAQQATLTPTPTPVFTANRDAVGCRAVRFVLVGGDWASEMGWDVKEALPTFAVPFNSYSTGKTYSYSLCLVPGKYTFEAKDSFGDGWNGGTYLISSGGALLASGTMAGGSLLPVPFTVSARTVTPTATFTSTITATSTVTQTRSRTRTITASNTATQSSTETRTTTSTGSGTATATATATLTRRRR